MSNTVSRRYLPTIIGLFIALGLPFIFSLYLSSVREQSATPSKVIQAMVREWGITILLLLIILLWERQSLSSIGIRKMEWHDVLWAIGGFLLGAVSFIITTPLVGLLGLVEIGSGLRYCIITFLKVTLYIPKGCNPCEGSRTETCATRNMSQTTGLGVTKTCATRNMSQTTGLER